MADAEFPAGQRLGLDQKRGGVGAVVAEVGGEGGFGGEHEGVVTTLSAGVAEHRPGETLRELMRRADLALYSAKREGRDRVCVAPVS